MEHTIYNKKSRCDLFHVSRFIFHERGFTLIEVLISTGIIAILALIVGQVYFLIITQITAYREQTVMVSLADQYMEVARNLPYSQIGTVSGNPHGNLADLPHPITTNVNGVNYQIYYAVSYVDDVADGTIIAGTDTAPDDYKQVKLYIKNTQTNFLNSFLTNIVPKGLEGLAFGGALAIKVFDAVGQPVSGASIHIQNNAVIPAIDITRLSNANGDWLEVALPNSISSYHITVTKNGYSSDQTYSVSLSNPSPIKSDATISNGQVTQISFSVDKTSNLTFTIEDQVCSPLPGISLGVIGSKLIGNPNVLKFNHSYVSDSNGQVVLQNIEWDSYVPGLAEASYMIYGTSPVQQATILPNTSETFSLIIGPKTTNSLLVIVKDASTSNLIEGATVNLQKISILCISINKRIHS
jgi:prepilin-type N-terminal cleavage/methylation domain-containing protein